MKAKLLAMLVLSAVMLTACGSTESSSDKETKKAAETTTEAAAETEAPAEDTEAETEAAHADETEAETEAETEPEADAPAASAGYESPEALMNDYYDLLISKVSAEDLFCWMVAANSDIKDEALRSKGEGWKSGAAEIAAEASAKFFLPDMMKDGTLPDNSYLTENAEKQLAKFYDMACGADITVQGGSLPDDINEEMQKMTEDVEYRYEQYKRDNGDGAMSKQEYILSDMDYYTSTYSDLLTKMVDNIKNGLKTSVDEGRDAMSDKNSLAVPAINSVDDYREFDNAKFSGEIYGTEVSIPFFTQADGVPMVCYEGKWYLATVFDS